MSQQKPTDWEPKPGDHIYVDRHPDPAFKRSIQVYDGPHPTIVNAVRLRGTESFAMWPEIRPATPDETRSHGSRPMGCWLQLGRKSCDRRASSCCMWQPVEPQRPPSDDEQPERGMDPRLAVGGRSRISGRHGFGGGPLA